MKELKIDEPDEYLCESNHYLINGKKYWRVTQVKGMINKPGLNAWRARSNYAQTQKYLHMRAEFGSTLHRLFEIKLNGGKVNHSNYDDETQTDLENFDEVSKKCKLKAAALEQHLWSTEYEIAGTADYIGEYTSCPEFLPKEGRGSKRKPVDSKFPDGAFVIGDWKTSPDVYGDFWVQLSAYAVMLEELTGIRVDGVFIARFRPDEKKPDCEIQEMTREELDPYFEVMKACIKLFKARQDKLI
jgi:hypothetical protein